MADFLIGGSRQPAYQVPIRNLYERSAFDSDDEED